MYCKMHICLFFHAATGLRENDADRRRDGDQDLRKDCEGDNTAHMLDDAMPMSTEL